MGKNDNLALLSAIVLIVALLTAVVVLLVFRIITLDQVGPFLLALIVPLTAIASLPIFKAALNAPSTEQLQQVQQQNQQLHGTLSQSIQALAQVAQPTPVQPVPVQVSTQGYNAPSSVQPNPVQPVQQVPQVPFSTPGTAAIPQMTAPLAAMPKQGQ